MVLAKVRLARDAPLFGIIIGVKMRTVQQNQNSEASVGLCIGGRQLADVFEIRANYMIRNQRTTPHGD